MGSTRRQYVPVTGTGDDGITFAAGRAMLAGLTVSNGTGAAISPLFYEADGDNNTIAVIETPANSSEHLFFAEPIDLRNGLHVDSQSSASIQITAWISRSDAARGSEAGR